MTYLLAGWGGAIIGFLLGYVVGRGFKKEAE